MLLIQYSWRHISPSLWAVTDGKSSAPFNYAVIGLDLPLDRAGPVSIPPVMRGDLSPRSKCLLGFVLGFLQVLLPILFLNLDLTLPGSTGLYYDITLST